MPAAGAPSRSCGHRSDPWGSAPASQWPRLEATQAAEPSDLGAFVAAGDSSAQARHRGCVVAGTRRQQVMGASGDLSRPCSATTRPRCSNRCLVPLHPASSRQGCAAGGLGRCGVVSSIMSGSSASGAGRQHRFGSMLSIR